MDTSNVLRLTLLKNQMILLINNVKDIRSKLVDPNSNINLENAKIETNKLKTLNHTFVTEIQNCCNNAKGISNNVIEENTNIQIQAEGLLAELDIRIKTNEIKATSVSTSTLNQPPSSAKLPTIELAKFDGEITQWQEFWDRFCSNIHNRNINDIDKFLYLKSVLQGEAKQTIEGLEVTNTNYQIAVQTLNERYGRHNTLIDAHYMALNKLKRAGNSPKECRITLNEVEKHLRILSSLGENIDNNNFRITIFDKFPEDILYELRLKLGPEDSVTIIREYLRHIISARETAYKPGNTGELDFKCTTETLHVNESRRQMSRGPSFCTNRSFRGKKYNQMQTQVSYPKYNKRKLSSASPPQQYKRERKAICVFCLGSHYNDECQEYVTIGQRKGRLSKKCFMCFKEGHSYTKCRYKRKCAHCGIFGKHNRALCPKRDSLRSPINTSSYFTSSKNRTLLQTAIIKIRRNKDDSKCIMARLLLDSGSQRSYINEKIMNLLNIAPVEENMLTVYTFGSNKPREIKAPLIKIEIQTRTDTSRTLHVSAISHITDSVPSPGDLNNMLQNDDIIFADDNSLGERIDVLIGNDYYHSFMLFRRIQYGSNLYLIETELGWIWSGCQNDERLNNHVLTVITYFQSDNLPSKYTLPDPPLRDDNIKQIWELETIGITDSPKDSREENALKLFNDTIVYQNNRYFVKWPWVEFPPTNMSDNFQLSFGRLKSLLRRLDQDTFNDYDAVIKEQLKSGVVEEILPTINYDEKRPIHYLPHHCVIQSGKTTKLRIVYDASAKTKSKNSLNECLYKGPTMLEDLTAILIRFRRYQFGVIADVEKAFLQVGLQEEDRDVTRFLWVKDPNQELSDNNNLIHLRFCRVPFGIISSPFLLAATIKHHLLKTKTRVSETILDNIYVDNLVTGADDLHELTRLYNESKIIFDQLSMNIREWCSNSEHFMGNIQIQDLPKQRQEANVLGMKWKPVQDTLSLKTDIVQLERMQARTKREVLKIIASIYDPCGFVAPILLPAKILLQDLWINKFKWDTPLTQDYLDRWENIKIHLKELHEFEIPRYLLCHKIKNIAQNNPIYELHCFCDASQAAYTAVVYLRSIFTDDVIVNFVMSKTRLTPVKDKQNLQIPKLELLGVLIGNRLMTYVNHTLQLTIKRQYLWTDSKVVLCWLQTEKILPPFVARRITEIKRNKETFFKYIPSHSNPADVGTRPCKEPIKNTQWFGGPTFLAKNKIQWPEDVDSFKDYVSCSVVEEGLPIDTNLDETQNIENNMISTNNHSKSREEDDIINIQKKYFPEEYTQKVTSLSKSLQLFKDDRGILRCKGRFQNTSWKDDQKFPILLPKNSDFTFDIIENIHRTNYHVGVSHTLALIRKRYWIPQGRSQVQKVIRRCKQCIKYGGGPYKLPPMPPLPPERVNYAPAFSYTGIDYMGPLIVSTGEKRWICLFTCLSVRAIHLEVVQNLTAEECNLALRRFISTRGLPLLVTSDNAQQFKLMAEVLTNKYCVENNIKWKFIPELAPWFGGFYERLMSLIKHCMKRTIDKHLLNDQQLLTVIKEIEAILNTRPLTYIGNEIEYVLTPADFLRIGGPLLTDPVESEFVEPATETKSKLIESWKRGQTILKEFINIFTNQYLVSLREKSPRHKEPRVTCNRIPKVGDVVQIKGDGNRVGWKVGKIKEIFKGSDNQIRVVKVRLGTGDVLTRAIAHVFPLEIEDDDTLDRNDKSDDDSPVDESRQAYNSNNTPEIVETDKESNPKSDSARLSNRQSAINARHLLRGWTKQLLKKQF